MSCPLASRWVDVANELVLVWSEACDDMPLLDDADEELE